MKIQNVEFKARVKSLEPHQTKLATQSPEHKGLDAQTDTYFNVSKGRLKLREGNIENALINYDRANTADSKHSAVILYRHTPDKALKDILTLQLGVKVVVKKQRDIYFIDNVKFHFDVVDNLGTFLEVEAIDTTGDFSLEELKKQCDHYFDFFELDASALVDRSYSDLLLEL